MHSFVSHRDLNQLLQRCIDAPNTLRFAVFHGVSNNRFKRLDISDARELLGYTPQDDFTEINPRTHDLHLSKVVAIGSQRLDGNPSGIRDEL